MPSPDFTVYSVESGAREQRRQSRMRLLQWALVVCACAVIAVFAYLIAGEGLL